MPADTRAGESDAELLERLGTDGQTWARTFVTRFDRQAVYAYPPDEHSGGVDEGLMIGWFANAIEAGRTAGRAEALGVGADVPEGMGLWLVTHDDPHLTRAYSARVTAPNMDAARLRAAHAANAIDANGCDVDDAPALHGSAGYSWAVPLVAMRETALDLGDLLPEG